MQTPLTTLRLPPALTQLPSLYQRAPPRTRLIPAVLPDSPLILFRLTLTAHPAITRSASLRQPLMEDFASAPVTHRAPAETSSLKPAQLYIPAMKLHLRLPSVPLTFRVLVSTPLEISI